MNGIIDELAKFFHSDIVMKPDTNNSIVFYKDRNTKKQLEKNIALQNNLNKLTIKIPQECNAIALMTEDAHNSFNTTKEKFVSQKTRKDSIPEGFVIAYKNNKLFVYIIELKTTKQKASDLYFKYKNGIELFNFLINDYENAKKLSNKLDIVYLKYCFYLNENKPDKQQYSIAQEQPIGENSTDVKFEKVNNSSAIVNVNCNKDINEITFNEQN